MQKNIEMEARKTKLAILIDVGSENQVVYERRNDIAELHLKLEQEK